MKHLSFKNGDKLPIIGLGTWKSNPGEVSQAVYWAIEAGYRHIDCAAVYQNENEVGEGIAKALAEGLVKREELFVTSKLWNNSHKKDQVLPALEKSLSDLKLDYVDLYLIHWPIAFKAEVGFPKDREDYYTYEEVSIHETWEAMQELKEKGLAKHIGVSNFNRNKLNELLEVGGQVPEMNQVEMQPYLPQEGLVAFCEEHSILMTAYSPLGSPDSRAEKHANDPKLLEDPVVQEIADKHKVGAGQILIAWSIARDIAVIPKSVNLERIKGNLASAKINLDDHDMMELRDIGISHRFIDGSFFTGENSPYKSSDLFDQN
ncbi:aldo/keto reductase [Algoriphagus antarcticus]|uniref:Alcohol dehydrogenase (NADP+) n=1 Tax=Algoriphagus antarcticus TaxID=238540 RepID=A0A3E0E726_9BACT|nr:aldo/keto reductase [Algoriphagus antarcticus]REG92796.1 alcohol dehydrogenase (NADP+) [Algoriphagus antarcticus]